MKKVTISDILTDDEIKRVTKLYAELHGSGTFARRCEEEIIRPNLARINNSLGQENNARYLAYMVEYACIMASQ